MNWLKIQSRKRGLAAVIVWWGEDEITDLTLLQLFLRVLSFEWNTFEQLIFLESSNYKRLHAHICAHTHTHMHTLTRWNWCMIILTFIYIKSSAQHRVKDITRWRTNTTDRWRWLGLDDLPINTSLPLLSVTRETTSLTCNKTTSQQHCAGKTVDIKSKPGLSAFSSHNTSFAWTIKELYSQSLSALNSHNTSFQVFFPCLNSNSHSQSLSAQSSLM